MFYFNVTYNNAILENYFWSWKTALNPNITARLSKSNKRSDTAFVNIAAYLLN